MNHRTLNKQTLLGVLSLFLIGGMLLFSFWMSRSHFISPDTHTTSTPEVSSTPEFSKIELEFQKNLTKILAQIENQNEVDANLLDELHSGNYSIDAPLVVTDPYGQSPLAALVLFSTSTPMNISIHISGKDDLTDVNFSFDGYSTDHIIPIYGLYPDAQTEVVLTAKDQSGKIATSSLKIETGALPEELSKIVRKVDLSDPSQYEPGFNFTSYNNGLYSKTAFDANGDLRWYLLNPYLQSSSLFNGHWIYGIGQNYHGSVVLLETNPLGRLYKVFYSDYGLHHDIAEYKNHLLVTGSGNETNQDLIYEIDPQSGETVNTLDLRTVFQRNRYTGAGDVDYKDWFHLNSIDWVEGTDDIVISGRNQLAVARISWPEGKIKWILGVHDGWLPMFQKYLLDPQGDTFEWQFVQHAAEIMPDQDADPDTMDLLLFDNGTQRPNFDLDWQRKVEANVLPAPQLFSRMVQYRINEKTMTVTQIWEFGKEMGNELYSPIRGDANLLANGNRLGTYDTQTHIDLSEAGVGQNAANFFEVNSQGQVVWEVFSYSTDPSGKMIEYRLVRAPIYNASDNDLQIGTPVENFIPEKVYEKYDIAQ